MKSAPGQLELPLGSVGDGPDDVVDAIAAPQTRGTRQRSIRLGHRALDYAFRRGRRRTIGLTITCDGLTVAAPRWVGIREIEATIREREAWILDKLAKMRVQRAAIPHVRWEDGGTVPYLGRPLAMRRGATVRRGASVEHDTAADTLTLSLPPDASASQWRDRVQAWLQNEARRLFRDRLAVYEARLGVAHRTLRLSSARTRWGSCSANGRILLNWRLIHFPLASIDYVVAHELAHLKEMNHSARFWSTVGAILPEYREAREQMRDPPPQYLPIF